MPTPQERGETGLEGRSSMADLIEQDWRRGALSVRDLPKDTVHRRAAACLVCTCARREADAKDHPQIAHHALYLLGEDFRQDPELRDCTRVCCDDDIDAWKGTNSAPSRAPNISNGAPPDSAITRLRHLVSSLLA